MRWIPASLVLLALLPAGAAAQAAPVVPGERVYVRHEGRRIEGTLLSLHDTLVIATALGPTVVEPTPHLIYRHVGYTSHAKGFFTGAAVGGLAGALIGATAGYFATDEGSDEYLTPDVVAGLSAVVFGAAGLLVGGLVGLSFAGDEWEAARLRPSVGIRPTADGALHLGLEAPF